MRTVQSSRRRGLRPAKFVVAAVVLVVARATAAANDGGAGAVVVDVPALAAAGEAPGIGVTQLPSHIHLAQTEERKSREELFAPADAVPQEVTFSVSGFYGLEVAYTYADPAHWSNAVNRLQLVAEGSLSENVKYKLGARVDVDPVYFGSDFYLPAVRQNQRLDAIWRENYIDVSAGAWDFRVGAQNIVWGEVVGLFFADVVSARDQREFLLPSFDIIRIPQWAARAEYSAGDSHLELVWIPIPTFDRIGKPGADFYPFPLPSPTSETAASTIGAIQKAPGGVANSSYGFRASTLAAGWDLSALYYRSFSADPTFYRVSESTDSSPLFQPRYDRIWQAGVTLTKDFDTFVLRGEGVYTHGKNFLSTDPAAPQGVVGRPTLEYIVSVDIPFATDARLNLQAFERVYFGGSSDVALNTGDFGVSVLLSAKLTRSIEPQILWIQNFGGGGSLVRPRINWYAGRNVSVAVGVDVFTGNIDSVFGRFNNRDRVFTELRYDF